MTAAIQSYETISHHRSSSHSMTMQQQSASCSYDSSRNINTMIATDVEDGSMAVVAPCDLDEGYTFLVTTSNDGLYQDPIPVTVPLGGVRQGQIFYTTMSRPYLSKNSVQSLHSHNNSSSLLTVQSISSNISEWTPLVKHSDDEIMSVGKWKDRWMDCCRHGLFHVTVWNACCCPQILAAQILSRLQLNWLGDQIHMNKSATDHRHSDSHHRIAHIETDHTFYRVFLLVISYWVLTIVTDPDHLPGPTSLLLNALLPSKDLKEIRRSHVSYSMYYVINVAFGLYTIIVMAKLRFHTRRKYRISPSTTQCSCRNGNDMDTTVSSSTVDHHGNDHVTLDDCCMAVVCTCCSVAQMARQTTSYYDSGCCSNDNNFSSNNNNNGSSSRIDNDGRMDYYHRRGHPAVCCSVDGLPQSS